MGQRCSDSMIIFALFRIVIDLFTFCSMIVAMMEAMMFDFIAAYWLFMKSGSFKTIMVWLSVVSGVIGFISTLSLQGLLIGFFAPAIVAGIITGLLFSSVKAILRKYI